MSSSSPRPAPRASEDSTTLTVPSDAKEQAVRVHEDAARLAERSGLSEAAEEHRDMAVQMRRGGSRAIKQSRV